MLCALCPSLLARSATCRSCELCLHLYHGQSRRLHPNISATGFMDAERADHIMRLAKARLAPSGLALRKGDSYENQRWVQGLVRSVQPRRAGSRAAAGIGSVQAGTMQAEVLQQRPLLLTDIRCPAQGCAHVAGHIRVSGRGS